MRARADNFGALRLAAATSVLLSHAWWLTGHEDPLAAATGESLGDVAVTVFFAVSGFLVAGSWCRDPHLLRFAFRRVRRIWPGLVVAVLVTAFLFGPLFTRLAPVDYLGSDATRTWVVGKVTMLGGGDSLPGVFHANPRAETNGSLWTLPVEVRAYIFLAVLALLGAFRGPRLLPAVWLAAVCGSILVRVSGADASAALAARAVYLLAVFLGGALLYSHRDRLKLHGLVVAGLIAAWVLSSGTVLQWAAGAVAFPYACLWIAYRTRPVLARFTSRTDLSYGIYLYSFPVEQAVRALAGASAGPLLVIAVALPVSGGLALLSWLLVEKPCLTRRSATGDDAAAAQPAELAALARA
ncbi:MAG TPA: acyltransferase [Thermoleophilaceae bacterium]|nr:acyltransferase [Thermoleophilaceae bacterium]